MRWFGDEPFDGRWAVQWNLALTAGDAPGRYLRLADRPALRSRGGAEGLYAIGLVDEWIGLALELSRVRLRQRRDAADAKKNGPKNVKPQQTRKRQAGK